MKRKLLILSLLYSLIGYSQETFHVLHLEGKISYDTIKVSLKVGDEINGNPRFNFSSKNDKAVLLSNLQGRMVLFPNKKTDDKETELYYYLKNNILPVKEYTATRGGQGNLTLLFFKRNKLFLPKKIKAFKIPEDNASFYLIEYSIGNKLHQDRLEISKDGFLELNSKILNLEKQSFSVNDIDSIGLKYYDNKSKKYFEITSLKFKCVQIKNIEHELIFYKKKLNNMGLDNKKIDSKLIEFLLETYNTDIKLSDFEID